MKECILALINNLPDDEYTCTVVLNKTKNILSYVVPPTKAQTSDILELTINEYKTLPLLIKALYELNSIVIKKSE